MTGLCTIVDIEVDDLLSLARDVDYRIIGDLHRSMVLPESFKVCAFGGHVVCGTSIGDPNIACLVVIVR